MLKKLPIYDIKAFQESQKQNDFYANLLSKHVKEHAFTNLPHKHDFYLTILVTKGSGFHEIDFKNYRVKPGTLFLLQPGQMHYWRLSKDIEGYVFFHSKGFFDEGFTSARVKDFAFFRSFQSAPFLEISSKQTVIMSELIKKIVEEYHERKIYKFQKLHALVDLVYIEIARNYKSETEAENQAYLLKLQNFESLIEKNYKTLKLASDYASLLNITEKHLNRITRACLDKTSTQLIADRIVLEAKRMLMQGGLNVTQIADKLGYPDTSYFVRFFKKNTGETPLGFVRGNVKEKM